MTTPIVPVAKTIYLCDDVVEDQVSKKVHVVGLFNAVRPAPPLYPYRLERLCVFSQLTDGLGTLPIHVEVVNAATGELVFSSQAHPFRFPQRQTTVTVCLRVRGCLFPRPGKYLVELYVQGTFLDDRVLHLLGEGEEV